MKKPIFLVEENQVIADAFERLEAVKNQCAEEAEKLDKTYNEARVNCWETVEKELLQMGKIPDLEQSLTYGNWVVYLKDKDEGVKNPLEKLKSLLDGIT
jgi:hypothetical protein